MDMMGATSTGLRGVVVWGLMADEGQPEQLRTPNALATLNAVILENINSPKKEKSNGGRYTELND